MRLSLEMLDLGHVRKWKAPRRRLWCSGETVEMVRGFAAFVAATRQQLKAGRFLLPFLQAPSSGTDSQKRSLTAIGLDLQNLTFLEIKGFPTKSTIYLTFCRRVNSNQESCK